MHVIDLTRASGAPQEGQSNMFFLHSSSWDQGDLHHLVHDLYFIARSEAGRDQWLEVLQQRGMKRLDHAPICPFGGSKHHQDRHFLARKKLSYFQSTSCNCCDKVLLGEQPKVKKILAAHSKQLFPMMQDLPYLSHFHDKVIELASSGPAEEQKIMQIMSMRDPRTEDQTVTSALKDFGGGVKRVGKQAKQFVQHFVGRSVSTRDTITEQEDRAKPIMHVQDASILKRNERGEIQKDAYGDYEEIKLTKEHLWRAVEVIQALPIELTHPDITWRCDKDDFDMCQEVRTRLPRMGGL